MNYFKCLFELRGHVQILRFSFHLISASFQPTIFPIIENYLKQESKDYLDDDQKENLGPETAPLIDPKALILDDENLTHLYENVHFSNKYLSSRDTSMTACDLETLFHHLLPTPEYTPDNSFTFTFLLCSRLFMKPANLFQQVFFENFLHRVGLQKFYRHFIENLLYEWITIFPYDFLDENLMELFGEFAHKSNTLLEKNFSKNLRKYLEKKLNHLMFYENYLELMKSSGLSGEEERMDRVEKGGSLVSATTTPLLCGKGFDHIRNSSSSLDGDLGSESLEKVFLLDLFQAENNEKNLKVFNELKIVTRNSNLLDLCVDPLRIAQQLTLIEFERLSFIGPQEFVQTFIKEQLKNPIWADKLPVDVKSKCTRNVENYVDWFNRLSYLVATEILFQTKPKSRVKMLEFWIEVAWECFRIRNFNSLMAIIAGLNMSTVCRLKKMVSEAVQQMLFWLFYTDIYTDFIYLGFKYCRDEI